MGEKCNKREDEKEESCSYPINKNKKKMMRKLKKKENCLNTDFELY